ncbi:MAG TPA: phenylalanine--tRNA ligase subunit beta [Leptolyngbyaceae cyanobacterium M65_K2018_010]|nr:phenylalanine--tRNA ligase subunit beta [Leptolyngbyaceae cyanobacterium M65_K2018_010]
MPTVTFPLSYLQRLTATPAPLLEQLAFEYGLDATLQDQDLEVEVTAERPDLLAAEGFTRAINIYSGHPRTIPAHLPCSGLTVTVLPPVQPLRPYLAALVVHNAHLEDGGLEVLIQFQEKVTQTFGRQRKKIAIGVYDLDQIQGNLTYTAVPQDQLCFVPLHSPQPMTGRQILTDHPSGRLYGHTLPASDLVPVLRDAQGTILSMPPIINAAGVGDITPSTRNLFIDVTGILEQTVMETANILAHNFLDTGAEVRRVTIQAGTETLTTPNLESRPVKFSARFLNEIMGTAIPKAKLGQVLARMDLEVSGTDVVYVPTYRTDIFSEVDLAGDLLVALGIETLPAEPLAVKFHLGAADPLRQFVLQVSDLAQRMGLMEVKSHILTDPDILTWFSPLYLQTSNAKSRTASATRTTLQGGLLDILSRNINAPKPINIYETGEVLNLGPNGLVLESYGWGFASLDARASFSTAKAYVQTLLKGLGLTFSLAEGQAPYYIAGRSAVVQVGGAEVGQFGEVHPELLNYFSFPEPICAGELNLGRLLQFR